MEQFPALNTECFDQHIAERLNVQEPPRILIIMRTPKPMAHVLRMTQITTSRPDLVSAPLFVLRRKTAVRTVTTLNLLLK